ETGSTYGGWLAYGTGNDGEGSTTGVMLASKDQYSYFIATNRGVRMTYDDTCAVYCIDGEVTLVADGWEVTLDDSNGNWCPGDDDEQLLGKSSRLWQGLYAGNATIQTSDRRKKNSIEYDMEKYEEFFGMLKPTQYKMNNGDSGRYHVGFISQDIEEAMERAGLDSLDFAGFIKSPVHEVELENGDYDETTPIVDHKYALRYAEFVALNTHMIQKLMARVTELEAKIEAS
ncbi:MAG: tail fiber domain-containing protein, partial [Anaerotignum sp.]|nr:tail fiber domain-containing protein [Anaerotignum sp.]